MAHITRGETQQMQRIEAQVREVAQAMTERVDKVENQMGSIRLSQKEEAEKAVGSGVFGLKAEILQELDKEIKALETRLMVNLMKTAKPQ